MWLGAEQYICGTRKLDFYFRWLFPIEVLSCLRFIALPVVLMRLFGSPRYLNFPFVLWVFVYYGTMFSVFLTESIVTKARMAILNRTLYHTGSENLFNAEYSAPQASEASIITDEDVMEGEDKDDAIAQPANISDVIIESEVEMEAGMGSEKGFASERMIVNASPVAQSEEAMQLATVESEDEYVLYFSPGIVGISLFIVNTLDIVADLVIIIVSWIISWGIFTQSNFGSDRDLDPAWTLEYYIAQVGLFLSLISIVQHFLFFFLISPCASCCHYLCDAVCSPEHERETQFRSWTLSKRTNLRHKVALFLYFIFSLVAVGFCLSYAHEVNMRRIRGNNVHYSDCDPMVAGDEEGLCMYPFPSMQYLRKDSSTSTGYMFQADDTKSAPPIKLGGRLGLDFLTQSYYDGFSVTAGLLWHVPNFVDSSDSANRAADQLVSQHNVQTAWHKSSLIIRMGSNELHPHFCTVDYLAEPTESRICYCQPARALDYNAQYGVVIKGLKDADGKLLPPSPLLRSYIDSYKSGSRCCGSDRDKRYERFKKGIFPLLERKGIDLETLQLVWDFHTMSYDSSTRLARSVHTVATEKMKSSYDRWRHNDNLSKMVRRIESERTFSQECPVITGDGDYLDEIATIATYKVKVPWILKTDKYIGTKVIDLLKNRGYNNPHQLGRKTLKIDDYDQVSLREVSLVVMVPCSVATGRKHVSAVIEWGHGIFADRNQVTESFNRKLANQEGWIMWAMDWRGFDRFGFPLLARAVIHDGGRAFSEIYYNVVQSFVSRIAVRDFTLKLLLQYDEKFLQLEGDGKLDQIIGDRGNGLKSHHYMGASMGAILGGGYVHASGIARAVFYVGGSPFTYVVGTTSLAGAYLSAVDLQFYRRTDTRLALSFWQMALDEVETAMYSQKDPVHNSYKKDVLLLAAQGDSVVIETAAEIMSRNVNATLMIPSVDQVPALPSGSSQKIKTSSFASRRGVRALFLASYRNTAAKLQEYDRKTPRSQPGNSVHGCFPSTDVSHEIVASFMKDNLQNKVDCGNTEDAGCILNDSCGN